MNPTIIQRMIDAASKDNNDYVVKILKRILLDIEKEASKGDING
jgi:hypothetical protein